MTTALQDCPPHWTKGRVVWNLTVLKVQNLLLSCCFIKEEASKNRKYKQKYVFYLRGNDES